MGEQAAPTQSPTRELKIAASLGAIRSPGLLPIAVPLPCPISSPFPHHITTLAEGNQGQARGQQIHSLTTATGAEHLLWVHRPELYILGSYESPPAPHPSTAPTWQRSWSKVHPCTACHPLLAARPPQEAALRGWVSLPGQVSGLGSTHHPSLGTGQQGD